MDADVREALYRRTNGYCDVCGLVMAEDEMAAHHRKRRSQVGGWNLANLLGCHHGCHNLGTRSIHANPYWAHRYGYLLMSWEPDSKPVFLHHAYWVQLHDDGQVEYLAESYEGEA